MKTWSQNQVTVTGVPSRRNLESSSKIPRRVDTGDCHLLFPHSVAFLQATAAKLGDWKL
jgi:hypothetical protein